MDRVEESHPHQPTPESFSARLESERGQGSRAFPGERLRYTPSVCESILTILVLSNETKTAGPLLAGLDL